VTGTLVEIHLTIPQATQKWGTSPFIIRQRKESPHESKSHKLGRNAGCGGLRFCAD
jgi:hypothetical protein